MKLSKISFDFSDRPELVESLRLTALKKGTSQKEIVAQALDAFLAHEQENLLLASAATKAFGDWDNKEDSIYDDL